MKKIITSIAHMRKVNNMLSLLRETRDAIVASLLKTRLIQSMNLEEHKHFLANKVITHLLDNAIEIGKDFYKIPEDLKCHEALKPYRGKVVMLIGYNDWEDRGTRNWTRWYRTLGVWSAGENKL